MPARVELPVGLLLAFVLVLARVGGVFIFVPLPGISAGPAAVRVFLALTITLALFPKWPQMQASAPGAGQYGAWLISEAALGITIGLAVSLLLEIFALAAQLAGLQAGFGFAATVDPTTQADSTVLLLFAQLSAGLLFFALGLDRQLIRALASSLDTIPPGGFFLGRSMATPILQLGSQMFSTGLRLAMPVVALLLLVDVALALVGRINSQLQLLTLAFPIKIMAALLVLGWLTLVFGTVLRSAGDRTLYVVRGLLGV